MKRILILAATCSLVVFAGTAAETVTTVQVRTTTVSMATPTMARHRSNGVQPLEAQSGALWEVNAPVTSALRSGARSATNDQSDQPIITT
jgi:hypothetical protein